MMTPIMEGALSATSSTTFMNFDALCVHLQIWYPVNQLRNYARLQARTPLVAIIDGDLLVSPSLVDQLRAAASGGGAPQVQAMMEDMQKTRSVYVLPAFITRPMALDLATQLAEALVQVPKARLQYYYDNGTVLAFDPGKPGHNATDYSRWVGGWVMSHVCLHIRC